MALIIIQPNDTGLDGIDGMIVYLENLEKRIPQQLADAARRTAPPIEIHATGTTAYKNQTGATRASTVVAVSAFGEQDLSTFEQAINAANDLRAASADDQSIPPAPGADEIVTDIASMTNYSKWLNERNGGESMYLEAALMDNVPNIVSEYQKVFGRYFRP